MKLMNIKKIVILLISAVLASKVSYSQVPHPELLPDLDGYEYKKLLSNQQIAVQDPELDAILKIGKKNLEWLEHINKFRTDKLSFTTPENMISHLIDNPRISNKELVLKQFNEMLSELPEEMKQVIIGNQPFSDAPPIAEAKYLRQGLLVDTVYQAAARLTLLMPHLDYYKTQRANDIRGYYYLNHIADLLGTLKNYLDLSQEQQILVFKSLLSICYNTEKDDDKCLSNINKSLEINQGDATDFYNNYSKLAKTIYTNYFIIQDQYRRTDITWEISDNSQKTIVPFSSNNINETIKNFLHNIELEWHLSNWQLVLDYVNKDNIPYIEFKPGTTPHVNKIGGNQIIMDSNQPLTEWGSQWAIRHEFGHVLGFSDCYVEFYDDSINAFINYQIDTSNLMCSRKGKLKKMHFLEMKRQYSLNNN